MKATTIVKYLLVIASISVLATNSYAGHKLITSYDQLNDALLQGHQVRGIMLADKCNITVKDKAMLKNPPITNGGVLAMNFTIFNRYAIEAKDHSIQRGIATYASIMIDHSQFGYVSNYLIYKIQEDNSMVMLSKYYDLKTNTALRTSEAHCKISNGSDGNGFLLYDLDE